MYQGSLSSLSILCEATDIAYSVGYRPTGNFLNLHSLVEAFLSGSYIEAS